MSKRHSVLYRDDESESDDSVQPEECADEPDEAEYSIENRQMEEAGDESNQEDYEEEEVKIVPKKGKSTTGIKGCQPKHLKGKLEKNYCCNWCNRPYATINGVNKHAEICPVRNKERVEKLANIEKYQADDLARMKKKEANKLAKEQREARRPVVVKKAGGSKLKPRIVEEEEEEEEAPVPAPVPAPKPQPSIQFKHKAPSKSIQMAQQPYNNPPAIQHPQPQRQQACIQFGNRRR
jgi:hypothetical protein